MLSKMSSVIGGGIFVLLSVSGLALDIVTSDGVVFKDCRITKVESESLVFSHQDGSARISYEKLPAAIQGEYFDLAKIAANKERELQAKAIAVQRQRDEELKDKQRIHDERQERDAKLKSRQRKRLIGQAVIFGLVLLIAVLSFRLAFTNFAALVRILGIVVASYFFFFYDTTVATERRYISGIGSIGGERVHNKGLLQNRLLGCLGGVSLVVVGFGMSILNRSKQGRGG